MSLRAGLRLGPYEIVSPLGAGGMGEVYRARDTRLDRAVAIKILPSDRPLSPEARQRFEREARTASQLSHPHICALYDIGSQATDTGPVDYLVMELLEGETLATRLERGPLPLEETLRNGVDIADALDRAHRQGIVHRDLKPSNVMLTRSGVKLLDFGLAKAMAPAAPGASTLTGLPTRAQVTQEGAILGTLQYMSPEQLEGKEADPRSDLFAFGALLYEMATGRKAFSGSSQASLISAIMTAEPPALSSLVPASPPALDRVITTCLAKDPENRWQSARDLGRELRFVGQGEARAGAAAAARATGRAGGMSRLALGAVVAMAIAAGVGLGSLLTGWRAPAALAPPLLRLSITPPEKATLMSTLAISPDGRRVAMIVADNSGTTRLWVRPLDGSVAAPIARTEGARFPFWSPDSRFIAYYADGKLRRVGVAGGDLQALADITDFRGGSWGIHDDVLFTTNANEALYSVAATGGPITQVTTLDPANNDESHRWPYFLPDGRRFLFLCVGQKSGIYLGSLDDKTVRRIVPDVMSAPIVVPPGYLLYTSSYTLLAREFDLTTGDVRGQPKPIAEDIWRDPTIWGDSAFSVSTTGIVTYRPGTGGEMHLAWFDRAGRSLGFIGEAGVVAEPSLSPDEKRAILGHLDRVSGRQDLWIHDLVHGGTSRFAGGPGFSGAQTPVWSPDGKSIVYSGIRGDGYALVRRAVADANAVEETLVKGKTAQIYADDWSFDGRYLLYEQVDPTTKYDLYLYDFKERQTRRLVATEFNETHSSLSRDGRYLAFVSDESGRGEVYVQGFPVPGAKWPISSGGGDQPHWRPDGRELFYLSPSRTLMSVDLKEGPAGLEVSTPKPLFTANLPETTVSGVRNAYVPADQGRKFLVTQNIDEGSSLQVIVNWPAALRHD